MTRRLMAGRFRQVDEDGVVGRCEPGRLLDGPFDLRHPVMEAIDHRRHPASGEIEESPCPVGAPDRKVSRGHPSRSTFDRRTGQGRLETNRLEGSLSNDQCRTSHHRAKPRPTWLAETHNYGRASNSPWVRLSVGPGPRMALKAGVCRQGSRQLCDSASCPCGSLQATAGTGAGLSALGLAPSVEADHQWRRIPVPTPEPLTPVPTSWASAATGGRFW